MACPGGHLKSLELNGVQLAQINMNTNRVAITNDEAELLSISWTPGNIEMMVPICGDHDTETCDHDQDVGFNLLKYPNSSLVIKVNYRDQNITFKASHFSLARDIGGCAEVVYPEPY